MLKPEGEPLVIGIVGPTGSGKTTLANRLGELLDLPVYEEISKNNPYLKQYYEDIKNGNLPSPAALRSQLHFLLESLEQARQIQEENSNGAVWDVPPIGHRMYAVLAKEQGIMDEENFEFYDQFYNIRVGEVLQPNLSFVATTKHEKLVGRIHDRAREDESRMNELGVNPDYWARQVQYWQIQLDNDTDGRLVEADSGEHDWLNGRGAEEVWAMAMLSFGLVND